MCWPLDDGAKFIGEFREGFLADFRREIQNASNPNENFIKGLLYDLLRTRLATTITILAWREAARGGADAYLQKALQERSSERFLVQKRKRISRDGSPIWWRRRRR